MNIYNGDNVKVPNILNILSDFVSTVESYAEEYWIWAIISVVVVVGFIIYSVVT